MPFPFLALALSAAFTVAGQLLAPRPKSKAAGLNELDFPTATESRPIPYFFGTVEHKSPNTLWYGDYSTKAIKTGGIATFFIKTTVGYKYHVGFDLGLSVVEFDALKKITINDKVAWEGSVKNGSVTIDKPELFGKAKAEGGFQATVEVYSGTATQTTSPYLLSKASADYPPARRRGHVTFRGLAAGGAYIGNSPRLAAIKFVLERFPNQLGAANGKHKINGGDANPVCVLYEILTNPEIGAGYVASDFNLAQWRAQAEVCHSEGLGISGLIDSQIDVDRLVDELLNALNGVINQNLETAEFELDLARADYDINTVPVLTMDDVASIEYERTSWLDNTNSLKLSYIDRENDFRQRDVSLSNTAMQMIQAEGRAQAVDVKFISTGALANQICYRELIVGTLPLARVKLTVNRKAYDFRQGTVFKLTGTPYGISSIAFRVVKAPDHSALTDGHIRIEAIEDVFGLNYTIAAAPGASKWTPPATGKANITNVALREQPRFYHGTDNTRLMALAVKPNGAQQSFDLYAKTSSDADYAERISEAAFTPYGILASSYVSTAFNAASQLIVTPLSDMDDLPARVQASDIQKGAGLIQIDNEILAYESYTINGAGQFVFNNVWGGLLDTVLTAHASGAGVYFISEGAALPRDNFTGNSIVNAKLCSNAADGAIDLATASAHNLATASRAARPLTGVDLQASDTATAGGSGMATVFSDDFNDDSIDAARWTVTTAGAGTVTETSNRIELAISAANGDAAEIKTAPLNLLGASAQIDVVSYVAQSGRQEANFQIQLDAANYAYINLFEGYLKCAIATAGVLESNLIPLPTLTKLRFRHDPAADLLHFEYYNGSAWVSAYSIRPTFSLKSVRLRLYCDNYNSHAGNVPTKFVVDNVAVTAMPVLIADEMTDGSLMTSYTANTKFDNTTGTRDTLDKDTGDIAKTDTSEAQMVYSFAPTDTFNIAIKGYNFTTQDSMKLRVEKSSDGGATWTDITPTTTPTMMGVGGGWSKYLFAINNVTGVNRIRLRLLSSTAAWSNYIGHFYAVRAGASAGASGQANLSWKHRDYRTQSVLKQTTATETLVAGQTYTLEIRGAANNLLRTVTGLTTDSYAYTATQELADSGNTALQNLTFRLKAVLNGLDSFQTAIKTLNRN